MSIPACVTHGDVDDLVYNDFYVGDYAEVTIVAGCGVHTETGEPARHNGIHRFFLGKGSRVKYVEKHVGTGRGTGIKSIDPVTECHLDEGRRPGDGHLPDRRRGPDQPEDPGHPGQGR